MAQKIQNKINLIIKEFQDGNLEVAEKLAINFKDKYPKNDFGWRLLGIIYAKMNVLRLLIMVLIITKDF